MFCATLRMLSSSSSGLSARERVGFRDLVGFEAGVEQAFAAAVLLVAERHIAGFVRRDGEREAAEAGLHRIEAGGLGVDGDHAEVVGARDPGFQTIERTHALVFRAVDLLLARGLRARGGERDRGEAPLASLLAAGVACGTEANRSPAFRRRGGRSGRARPIQFRIGLDLRRVDAALFGDAAGNGVEFHRLEEGDQVFVVRLMHRELIDRHVERHVLVERDQPLGNARDLGIVDQRLPALVLFDFAGALEQRFQIAIFADQLRRGLDADARHARHVVGRSRRSAPAPRSPCRVRRRISPSPRRRRCACPSWCRTW